MKKIFIFALFLILAGSASGINLFGDLDMRNHYIYNVSIITFSDGSFISNSSSGSVAFSTIFGWPYIPLGNVTNYFLMGYNETDKSAIYTRVNESDFNVSKMSADLRYRSSSVDIVTFRRPYRNGTLLGSELTGTSISSFNQGTGQIRAYPFYIGLGYTFDQISLAVATQIASANCSLAIYNDTGSLNPDKLVMNTTNLAMSMNATIGLINATVPATTFKNDSIYWTSFWCVDGTSNMRFYGHPMYTHQNFLGYVGTGTSMNVGIYVTATYNATYPAIFPSGTQTMVSNANIPAIFMRVRTDIPGTVRG